MRFYLILLLLFSSFSALGSSFLELSGSVIPINGTIHIGSSDTDISLNNVSANLQFHEHISLTISKFWNNSSVEIYNLSLNYEYLYQLNEIFSLEPNVGLGLASYQESTPIQPQISSMGISFNSSLKLGIAVNEKIKIRPALYYNSLSFSQGVIRTKGDSDIIVDQLGVSLGIQYSW